jgi:autotransporter-associated beta strand protein
VGNGTITNNGNYNAASGNISAVLAGPGNLIKTGSGTLVLGGSNTFAGSTTISNGSLEVAPTGSLRFVIGASGSNNAVTGAGSALFQGSFVIDLSGAGTNIGNSWTLVTAGSRAYDGSFLVAGFSESPAGTWRITNGGVPYQFVESNSILSVVTNAPTPYDSWASYWNTNSPGGFTNSAGTANPDGDPFNNNMEFAFDGNPTIGTGALLTATKVGTNAVFNYVALTNTNAVTYLVKNTTNLATGPWTNSSVTISNSTNQTGLNIPADYRRKEFVVPVSASSFYRVEAVTAL